MTVTTGDRTILDHAGGVFEEAFDGLVLELLFDGDDLGVRAELARHILDQLAFERLVDGDEDALHQEGGDEVLAADVELFGEVLDADAFGHRDGAGDGHGLARDLRTAETRWRLEALHRAFLGLLVALVARALARPGIARRPVPKRQGTAERRTGS